MLNTVSRAVYTTWGPSTTWVFFITCTSHRHRQACNECLSQIAVCYHGYCVCYHGYCELLTDTGRVYLWTLSEVSFTVMMKCCSLLNSVVKLYSVYQYSNTSASNSKWLQCIRVANVFSIVAAISSVFSVVLEHLQLLFHVNRKILEEVLLQLNHIYADIIKKNLNVQYGFLTIYHCVLSRNTQSL